MAGFTRLGEFNMGERGTAEGCGDTCGMGPISPCMKGDWPIIPGLGPMLGGAKGCRPEKDFAFVRKPIDKTKKEIRSFEGSLAIFKKSNHRAEQKPSSYLHALG